MKRGVTGKTHKEVLKNALRDADVRNEYEGLKHEFEVRRALIYLRKSMNMTQQELAEALKTKQEYVSRIEHGRVEISIPYLAKLANALGADMEIVLTPRNGDEKIRTLVSSK